MLQRNYPEIPLGNIFMAALKIDEADYKGDKLDENFIDTQLRTAEEKCQKLL